MVEAALDPRIDMFPQLSSLSPKPACNLAQPLKDTLDRIGAKCTTIANNTPTTATRLIPIIKIQRFDLEKVTDNLFRPKVGSFPMQVSKYLAQNFNLQTITYQQTPGVLDSSSKRLPQDYYLAILLQGVNIAQQEQASINVEDEYATLLSCIFEFTLKPLLNVSKYFYCFLNNSIFDFRSYNIKSGYTVPSSKLDPIV